MAKSALKLPTSKALSIWHPWAWAIIHAGKNVENRSWATAYRGPLLIHSGKNSAYFEDRAEIEQAFGITIPTKTQMPFGAIVGYVELVDCVYSELPSGKWGQPGCYHWILENARSLDTPIFVRGFQRIFNICL